MHHITSTAEQVKMGRRGHTRQGNMDNMEDMSTTRETGVCSAISKRELWLAALYDVWVVRDTIINNEFIDQEDPP